MIVRLAVLALAASAAVLGCLAIILLDIPPAALAVPTGIVAGGLLLRGRMQP